MIAPTRLDLALEATFTVGLAVSAPLLAAGLLAGSPVLLQTGLLVLISTPPVGAVVVMAGLILRRDWTFALVSLVILLVLGSSLYAATRIAGIR